MVIPQGVNIPMPKPFGGIPPAISRTPLGEDAAGGELITISLVGEIGPITQYLEVLTALDTASEHDQVKIVLDTPGGDVYTAQQIVGRMESCKANVTTVASGLVASAGTFIWTYGKSREVERWARFMFHSSLHGDWGKSLVIQENAAELVKFMAYILSKQQREGILIAAEVTQILKGKGDVELSAGTVKRRIAMTDDPDNPGDDDNQNPNPDETDDDNPGDGGDDNPSARKLTKRKIIKKTKRRIAEDGNGNPAPTEGDDGKSQDDDGAGNGDQNSDGTTVEDLFAQSLEENGVDAPPAEDDDDNGDSGKPGEGDDDGAGGGDDGDTGGGEPGDDDGTGEDDDDDDGNGEPPAAKRGKKKAKPSKRRRGEGGDEGNSGTDTELGEGKANSDSIESLFNTICEENGVAVPPPEEDEDDDDDDDDDGEDNDDDGEGDDDDGTGETGDDGAPQDKCRGGKKRGKAKKPAKKRRGEGEGTDITTGTDNDADNNSDVKKVPSSRYW